MQDFNPTALTIGLTGGIGSGKTVCSDHFQTIGVPVVDTDVIAREVVKPGKRALEQLVAEFGPEILQDSGELDRGALRTLAFADADKKRRLDAITHPAIREETVTQISRITFPYCVVVIPLLNDASPFFEFLRRILVVSCDHEVRVKRVMQRSQLARDEVLAIMQTQLSDAERERFADDIINNTGTIAEAKQQIEDLHQSYLELALAN